MLLMLLIATAAESVYVVGAFDIGDYVYYFFRELALESTAYCSKTYYSRVARICKVKPTLPFLSFFNYFIL